MKPLTAFCGLLTACSRLHRTQERQVAFYIWQGNTSGTQPPTFSSLPTPLGNGSDSAVVRLSSPEKDCGVSTTMDSKHHSSELENGEVV
jgi:hypothetical protein